MEKPTVVFFLDLIGVRGARSWTPPIGLRHLVYCSPQSWRVEEKACLTRMSEQASDRRIYSVAEQDWIDKYRKASQAAEKSEVRRRGTRTAIREWVVTLRSRVQTSGVRHFIGQPSQPASSPIRRPATSHLPDDPLPSEKNCAGESARAIDTRNHTYKIS